eukprot:5147368-Pleurochrysis_carterae.AAC.3
MGGGAEASAEHVCLQSGPQRLRIGVVSRLAQHLVAGNVVPIRVPVRQQRAAAGGFRLSCAIRRSLSGARNWLTTNKSRTRAERVHM